MPLKTKEVSAAQSTPSSISAGQDYSQLIEAPSPDRRSDASTATEQLLWPPALGQRRKRRRKSAKRKAAEELLATRYAADPQSVVPERSEAAASTLERSRIEREHVALKIPACGPQCSCHRSRHESHEASSSSGWCGFDLQMPHTSWRMLMDAMDSQPMHGNSSQELIVEGVRIVVVEQPDQLSPAIAALRESMEDPVVALDLEWRPDRTAAGRNRVALMQLATSTVCVLVRTNRMKQLPLELEELLRDPEVVTVGYSWDSADEQKMRQSFKLGRSAMPNFLDLQNVSQMLGYHGYGLGTLAAKVLGLDLQKARMVAMSDWEARTLSRQQIVYAALDSLITGEIFRSLRLWHAAPSECAGCALRLGALPSPAPMRCTAPGCSKHFANSRSMLAHVGRKGHGCGLQRCRACGRLT